MGVSAVITLQFLQLSHYCTSRTLPGVYLMHFKLTKKHYLVHAILLALCVRTIINCLLCGLILLISLCTFPYHNEVTFIEIWCLQCFVLLIYNLFLKSNWYFFLLNSFDSLVYCNHIMIYIRWAKHIYQYKYVVYYV